MRSNVTIANNLIYITNGSIGDFLIVLHSLVRIYQRNKEIKFFILTPRNGGMFCELAQNYPFINIKEVGTKSVWKALSLFWVLVFFVFQKNLVVTPPTFGFLPRKTKLVGKCLSLRKRSYLAGFFDEDFFGRGFYDSLFTFDTHIPYVKLLWNTMNVLGFKTEYVSPSLSISSDDSIFSRLGVSPSHYVMVHPVGAVPKRSITESELSNIIEGVLSVDASMKIIVTGSPADRIMFKTLEKQFSQGKVLFMFGILSMVEIATLLRRSALFIGVDTGPTHLANMCKVKSLVIAHHGTPNWLPYYNKKATILYSILGCGHSLYKGEEHLKKCGKGKTFPLERVPMEIINKELFHVLST